MGLFFCHISDTHCQHILSRFQGIRNIKGKGIISSLVGSDLFIIKKDDALLVNGSEMKQYSVSDKPFGKTEFLPVMEKILRHDYFLYS